MKLYTIEKMKGRFAVSVESDIVKDAKGRKVPGYSKNPLPATRAVEFCCGDSSKECFHLAEAVLADYLEKPADQLGDMPHGFMTSFLMHHQMKLGSRYEISSDVIDRWARVWREIPSSV